MTSLRSKLILWNTAMLAIGLLAVGGTIAWLNLSRMARGIDQELLDRARGLGGPPGGLPPAEGSGSVPRGPGGPFEIGGFGPRGRGEPLAPPVASDGERQRPGRPPAFRFIDPQAERIGAIRRPRILDPRGMPPEGTPDSDLFDPGAATEARAKGAHFSDAVFRGEAVRVYTAPAPRFGEGWTVQVARELRDYRELARVQWLTLFSVLPLGLFLAALGGRFLTSRAMRPIGRMGEAASEIGSGAFERRIEVEGDDEFARLGRNFNEMAERLGRAFSEQRAAYERLESAFEQQRRFVADASHELRTPLTRLRLATSSALNDPSADLLKSVQTADDSGRAMAKLVAQLLELARADAGELKPLRQRTDLRVLAADVVRSMPETGAPIRLDAAEGEILAEVDPDQIARALSNLLDNARRHTPETGCIVVAVREALIGVQDDGEGIPKEHLSRVTGRFYRVDSARSREAGGAGLGLSIADEIMRAHGGSLCVESEPGKGTSATLRFP